MASALLTVTEGAHPQLRAKIHFFPLNWKARRGQFLVFQDIRELICGGALWWSPERVLTGGRRGSICAPCSFISILPPDPLSQSLSSLRGSAFHRRVQVKRNLGKLDLYILHRSRVVAPSRVFRASRPATPPPHPDHLSVRVTQRAQNGREQPIIGK